MKKNSGIVSYHESDIDSPLTIRKVTFVRPKRPYRHRCRAIIALMVHFCSNCCCSIISTSKSKKESKKLRERKSDEQILEKTHNFSISGSTSTMATAIRTPTATVANTNTSATATTSTAITTPVLIIIPNDYQKFETQSVELQSSFPSLSYLPKSVEGDDENRVPTLKSAMIYEMDQQIDRKQENARLSASLSSSSIVIAPRHLSHLSSSTPYSIDSIRPPLGKIRALKHSQSMPNGAAKSTCPISPDIDHINHHNHYEKLRRRKSTSERLARLFGFGYKHNHHHRAIHSRSNSSCATGDRVTSAPERSSSSSLAAQTIVDERYVDDHRNRQPSPSDYCRVASCQRLHKHDVTPKCEETYAPSSMCSSCQRCDEPHIGPNHAELLIMERLMRELTRNATEHTARTSTIERRSQSSIGSYATSKYSPRIRPSSCAIIPIVQSPQSERKSMKNFSEIKIRLPAAAETKTSDLTTRSQSSSCVSEGKKGATYQTERVSKNSYTNIPAYLPQSSPVHLYRVVGPIKCVDN